MGIALVKMKKSCVLSYKKDKIDELYCLKGFIRDVIMYDVFKIVNNKSRIETYKI